MIEQIDNFAAHHANIYFKHNHEAHRTCLQLAREAIELAEPGNTQQAINILASNIKRIWRYANNPLKNHGHDLYDELLKHALANVDWPGIAEYFIESITE